MMDGIKSGGSTRHHVCSYFATCAGGLEQFVLEEARSKWRLMPYEQSVLQGKAYFQTSEPIVAKSTHGRPVLATAERLFVQLLRVSPLELPSPRTCKSALQQLDSTVTAAVREVQVENWWRGAELQALLTVGNSREADFAPRCGKQLRFRVCVKTGGRGAGHAAGQEMGSLFGRAIAAHVGGWEFDNTGTDTVQVYVQCNELHLLIGLAAGGASLSARPDIPQPGLRSTVAWAVARLALGEPARTEDNICVAGRQQRPSSLLVCDPLCGRGSLVLEAVRDWPAVQILAGDAALGVDSGDLLRSALQNNLQAVATARGSGVDIAVQDVRALPYRDGSIDVLLTDPPFGKQHSDRRSVRVLYPQMLAEMRRVVVEDGVLCMLCPNCNWDFFQWLVLPQSVAGTGNNQSASRGRSLAVWRPRGADASRCWRLDMHYPVRLGQLAVHLCRLLPTTVVSQPASMLVRKNSSEVPANASVMNLISSSGSVTLAGHHYTRRALHARCRQLTKSVQARIFEQMQPRPDYSGADKVLISGPDKEFLRSLFCELQNVRASSQSANETKKQHRISLIDVQQADIWYGTNPQAPHTKCFLVGKQRNNFETVGVATRCDGAARVAAEGDRVRNRALIVGAKAAGLEPLSLKRAVDELYGPVPNQGKTKKRAASPVK